MKEANKRSCIFASRTLLEHALRTAPHTDWEPRIVRDFWGQRLSLSNMRAQFEGQVCRTTKALQIAPLQWATTGKWPNLRGPDAFVLQEAILSALYRCGYVPEPDTTKAACGDPPWSKDAGEMLSSLTVEEWYRTGCAAWIDRAAREEFESQEDDLAHDRPFEH